MNKWRHGSKPVIGLVGGIGAGKSTASRCFEKRGGAVIDADAIGHTALGQPSIVEKIVQRWGDRVRKSDGSLDRWAIGQIVFANHEERGALEEMVFPFIREKCTVEIKTALDDSRVDFVVLDAPVLLEAGWNEIADRIVYVDAPRGIRLARVAARNGWNEQDLMSRESAQWPERMKKNLVDIVIENAAGSDDLQREIDRLLGEWDLLKQC